MSNRPAFVVAAPAPSAAAAARAASASAVPNRASSTGATHATHHHRDPSSSQSMGRDDAGQLIAMSSHPRLNPHSALKEFNNYLLQVLDGNGEEKRQIIARLRLVVQAQRSAAAVREDLMKLTMEFNETQRTAEELRLALQESREAQRRLEHENRVLQAQVEDDRAKIAALVKLCRAEIGGNGTNKGGGDILLSLHSHKTGAAAGAAASHQGPARRPTSASNATTGRAGSSVAAATPATASGGKSVSLRAACTTHGQDPAFNCPADGPGAVVTSSSEQQQHQQQDHSNTTTDIVAQVLAGSVGSSDSLIGNLRLESNALKQLLDEQRAAYEAARASHVRVARDCDRRHYEEAQRMAAEIRSLSDILVTSTKDLCETRANASSMQRQLRGEIEALVQRLAEAEKGKAVQSARQTEEMRVLAVSERSKNAGVTERLRAKLTHNEQKLHALKDNLEKEVNHLREALSMAQEAAARERRLRLRAEEHARLKAQGSESDLGLLRAQLRNLEKKAFFAHTKDIADFAVVSPPGNAPTETVDVPAPEDDNEAIDMNFTSHGGGVAAAVDSNGTSRSPARVPVSALHGRAGMRHDGGEQMAAIFRGSAYGSGRAGSGSNTANAAEHVPSALLSG